MNNIEQLAVNTIRILSAETVQKAKSGHPGLPMGAAAAAYALWAKGMKHNPQDPDWVDRDRFILGAGHGSALLYTLLHLFGYGLSIEDLKSFRQWGSKTPGHPEYRHTKGVEVTTGPLGQGLANGVGMAIAEAYLAARFNRPGYPVVDHYTYVLSGDGCMMEGVAAEAASLAGTLALGKLILLYDSNNITIEGDTDIAFREDVGKRFEAYGWQVISVEDGNDINGIVKALEEAKKELSRPSILVIRTQIGYGCPSRQGKASAHGEPLGEEGVRETKEFLGWRWEEPFTVPDEVKAHMEEVKTLLAENEADWKAVWASYEREYPELAAEWKQWHSEQLSVDLLNNEELWSFTGKPAATRASSGDILNRLSKLVPNLIGGSADLAPSNKSDMKGRGDFSAENRTGSNLHFGVREHAMAAISNGIAVHGGLIPYAATFFVFSDYMKHAMRLSAIMGLPVTYILTHDSIGVGEDGPTHEPVEQLAALRSLPNFTVFRPADAKETAAGWVYALTNGKGPTALVLTRQNLPFYQETGKGALKGAYILADAEGGEPDMILMASGSEVEQIYEAAKVLKEKGIAARVVSMPSWELFEAQDEAYRKSVLPDRIRTRLAVEAGSSFGWHRYTGLDGEIISMDTFGASAPAEILFREFGFTVENVVERAMRLVKR
jgi:transketolase